MIDVLVVDDDFMVARIHRGYVERIPGFRVVGEAHSAAEALDVARLVRPDLVLLDVYLPDGSGLDVLRQLRAFPPTSAPDVVLVTAARDVDTVRRALQGGVVNFLVKPFSFAALRERLMKYAESRQLVSRSGELEQHDVDRVFALARSGGADQPPKGLSAATCDLVIAALREADGDLSAVETASIVGISRVSARRYLEHLARTGRAQLRPRYGAAGRPEHRYVWVR